MLITRAVKCGAAALSERRVWFLQRGVSDLWLPFQSVNLSISCIRKVVLISAISKHKVSSLIAVLIR